MPPKQIDAFSILGEAPPDTADAFGILDTPATPSGPPTNATDLFAQMQAKGAPIPAGVNPALPHDPTFAERAVNAILPPGVTGKSVGQALSPQDRYAQLAPLRDVGALVATMGTSKIPGLGKNPGTIALGALGGAAGESARQLAAQGLEAIGQSPGSTLPQDTADRLKQLGWGAVKGGTETALGLGLSKGLAKAGKGAVALAARITPEAAQTAVNEGIEASKAGFRKALTRLGEYGNQAAQAAAKATRQGTRYDTYQTIVTPTYQKLASDIQQSGYNVPERMNQLDDMVDKFVRDNSTVQNGVRTTTPAQLYQAQKSFNQLASGAQKAQKLAQRSPLDVESMWWNELRGTNSDLMKSTIPDHNGTSFADLMQRESHLIEIKDALKGFAKPGSGAASSVGNVLARRGASAAMGAAMSQAFAPSGYSDWRTRAELAGGGAALGGLLGTPGVMSKAGLMMSNPGVQAGAFGLPYLLGSQDVGERLARLKNRIENP